jgi:hypothetical protein
VSRMNKSWMLERDMERPTTARWLRERIKYISMLLLLVVVVVLIMWRNPSLDRSKKASKLWHNSGVHKSGRLGGSAKYLRVFSMELL